METLRFIAWPVWAMVTLSGFALFFLRSADTGFAYVRLSRLFYFFWVLGCVMLMASARAPLASALGLVAALAAGVYAMTGDEPGRNERLRELVERVKGCRRALESDERNPASLELIGDVYSTLEEGGAALRYWERSYALVPRAKLLEKMESVKRAVPVYPVWGEPCAHDLRACARCEWIGSRRAYACIRCRTRFYPNRWTWLASRFNRLWDESGGGVAVETALILLPFLFGCAAWAYVLACLCWLGARRANPGDPRTTAGAGREKRRALGRLVALGVLATAWCVSAGWRPRSAFELAQALRRQPPRKSSARVSWQTTP